VADIATEQPADSGAGLQGVLELYGPLLAGLRQAAPVDQQVSLLVDAAVAVWNRPGFDTFLSEASLRFSPFDYQLQAARSALRRMRGRAILADEVGLGKTIEAGLQVRRANRAGRPGLGPGTGGRERRPAGRGRFAGGGTP
jgi:hypothetical protein